MEEPEMYREAMLSDQSSTTAAASSSSSNLRDLLTVRQEEDLRPLRRQVANLSLGTVLACEKRELSQFTPGLPVVAPPPTAATTGSRTLLDIIRDEELPGGGRSVYDGVIVGGSNGGHKIGWRALKDRLRVRRAGAASVAADPLDGAPAAEFILPPPSAVSSSSETLAPEASAVPGNNPSPAVSVPGEAARTPAADTTPDFPIAAPSAEEQGEGSNSAPATAAATGTTPPPQQIRVSLMTLLEQTNWQGEGPGFAVSALWEAEGDEEEEEEGGGAGDDGGKMYVKCCVCMVRHKGAAFIPCGHTFCRRCSRELWVSRGNCPLCNGFILEILDIF